jgi:hypothetical protein
LASMMRCNLCVANIPIARRITDRHVLACRAKTLRHDVMLTT